MAFCGRKHAFNSVCRSRIFLIQIFHVIPFCSEVRNWLFYKPRKEHFLLQNNGTIPSLFRWIFSEQNSVANPMCNPHKPSCGVRSSFPSLLCVHCTVMYMYSRVQWFAKNFAESSCFMWRQRHIRLKNDNIAKQMFSLQWSLSYFDVVFVEKQFFA